MEVATERYGEDWTLSETLIVLDEMVGAAEQGQPVGQPSNDVYRRLGDMFGRTRDAVGMKVKNLIGTLGNATEREA